MSATVVSNSNNNNNSTKAQTSNPYAASPNVLTDLYAYTTLTHPSMGTPSEHEVTKMRMKERAWYAFGQEAFEIVSDDVSAIRIEGQTSAGFRRDRLVMKDPKDDSIQAIFAYDMSEGAYIVLGTTPLTSQQTPSMRCIDRYENLKLYEWAKISQRLTTGNQPFFVLSPSKGGSKPGSFGRPLYKSERKGNTKMIYQLQRPSPDDKATQRKAVAMVQPSSTSSKSFLTGDTDFDVTVSPGMDPILMIGFVAATEEMSHGLRNVLGGTV